MMGEWVPIQPEKRFVGLSLELVPLRLNISGFHVDPAIVELEDRDVAVSIDRYVVWMRGNEWIAHNTIKVAIDGLWHLAKDDQVLDFTLQPAR